MHNPLYRSTIYFLNRQGPADYLTSELTKIRSPTNNSLTTLPRSKLIYFAEKLLRYMQRHILGGRFEFFRRYNTIRRVISPRGSPA